MESGTWITGKFQGFPIKQNQSGFFWQEGGYFDDLAECQDDIAAWNESHRAPVDDAPCLDEPWWASR